MVLWASFIYIVLLATDMGTLEPELLALCITLILVVFGGFVIKDWIEGNKPRF